MCLAMHGVRLEGTSGRRNNLARLVVCGIKNAEVAFGASPFLHGCGRMTAKARVARVVLGEG
jgi:hypothetical protein